MKLEAYEFSEAGERMIKVLLHGDWVILHPRWPMDYMQARDFAAQCQTTFESHGVIVSSTELVDALVKFIPVNGYTGEVEGTR